MNFKPSPVEGAPIEAKHAVPLALLLDRQQRDGVTLRCDLARECRRDRDEDAIAGAPAWRVAFG